MPETMSSPKWIRFGASALTFGPWILSKQAGEIGIAAGCVMDIDHFIRSIYYFFHPY